MAVFFLSAVSAFLATAAARRGLASTPAGFTFLLNTLVFIGYTEFVDGTGNTETR